MLTLIRREASPDLLIYGDRIGKLGRLVPACDAVIFDSAGEKVLLLEEGHCLRDQALSFCEQAGASELGDFRASSLTTLVQMVSGGLGLTLIPRMAVKVETRSGRQMSIIPFGAGGPTRTIGLAWRKSSVRKPEYRLLGEAIQRGTG